MSGPVHPVRYAIQNALWRDGLWRDQGVLSRTWYRVWEWTFRVWDHEIASRIWPRRYARWHTRFWGDLRVPPVLEAYVTWEDEYPGEEHWSAKLVSDWGGFIYAVGDTEDEAKADMEGVIAWFAREASTQGKDYEIRWVPAPTPPTPEVGR